MFTKPPYKMIVCALLLAFLTNTSISANPAKSSTKRRPCSRAEESLLRELGLPEDVNDSEVIRLLDVPVKRIHVMYLITRRKISSAVPKLLQIVNDPNEFCITKIASAHTLCFFGNKEWMPTIKALSTDPNDLIAGTSYAIRVAGLLARAGDYSQFEIVAAAVGNSKDYIRYSGIRELANFAHKTDPVTDSAVELLLFVANADPDPFLRPIAIDSLEKIARKKPQIKPRIKVSDSTVELLVSVATSDPDPGLRQRAILSLMDIARKKPQTKPRLIYALKANKDSQHESLRRICRMLLDVPTPNRKEEKGKQP